MTGLALAFLRGLLIPHVQRAYRTSGARCSFVCGESQRRARTFQVSRRCMCMSSGGEGSDVETTSAKSSSLPTMVRARHILVDSEEMIDAIQGQLNSGKGTFSKLASLVSTCPSKAKGGDLGWFRRNTMVKEFENAAFDNPPGTVVKVHTDFGWHLVKVEAHGQAAKSMDVKEFAKRYRSSDDDEMRKLQLIDCRERNELEFASLPGFINLPMGEYGSWADDFANGQLNLDKKKETIVMCHHGIRSANFCTFLAQQGFENVTNLVGGIDAYAREIDKSVPLYG